MSFCLFSFYQMDGSNHMQKNLQLLGVVTGTLRFLNMPVSKSQLYLEKIKRYLFLNAETADFVMINKIKIYTLSYLFLKVVVSCNLPA